MAELQDLLVNRGELDKQLLAEVLFPFIGIDPDRQEIVPREGWSNLKPEGRILVVLLAQKAMCAMSEVGLDVEGLTSKELERSTGLKGGTLRPTLTRMKDKGLVMQEERKRYCIPLTGILAAKAAIAGGSNGQGKTARRTTRRRRTGKRSI